MKKHYAQLTQRVLLSLLWVSLLMSQNTWAQSIPDAQWARVGSTLAITTDGNIVTSAALLGTGVPLTTPVGLKKYDLQGNLVWQTNPLAGVSNIAGKLPPGFCPCAGGAAVIDRIGQISPAPDGGIRLLGNEWGGAGIRAGVDAAGRQTGSSFGGGSNLLVTPNGGSLYVSTFVEFVGSGSEKRTGVLVEKTGNPSWTAKVFYPTPAPDFGLTKANAAINTPDGGYLIVGFYNSFGANSPGVPWAAKLDENGNVSWQKLISPPALTNFPGPGDINSMKTITDAIISADGTGYALVGSGTAYPNINSTVLVEIDGDGNGRPGRAKAIDIQQATNAYLTTYTGSNGKKYYAVGNTSLQDRVGPQLLLVDPATALVATKRVFQGPGQSSLIDIATAGDGSLVFVTDNNQLVKLNPEPTTPTPPTGGSLALLAPIYNCATGAFTFNISGGNGSPIEYQAPGITGWTTNPNQFVDRDSRTASDVQPFNLMARQNGVIVTYIWDLRAYCTGTPPPPVTPPTPPVTPPTNGALSLLAPTYNCATGAITFNTSGGNGSPIEYQAPGITGWTTNPNQFVDRDSRTASDVQPFTLMARQNGVTVSYVWDLRAYCTGTPPPPVTPPPVTPPTSGSLALTTPTYNCDTGAFTFNTSGGNGASIEYQAPGITGWTTNPNQFVDRDSRTANDVQPFTLMARQNGVTVSYVWDLRAACGRLARRAALAEPNTQLRVRVLGNPILNQTAEVDITGAEHQALHLNLVDLQGRVLRQQRIDQPEATQRVRVPLGEQPGLFLLNVSTPTQHQQLKLVKP